MFNLQKNEIQNEIEKIRKETNLLKDRLKKKEKQKRKKKTETISK